jgi:phosphatidylinositol glycan class H protein
MSSDPLTYQQNGQTLSYICESSACSLVKTHKIVVARKKSSPLFYILLLAVLILCSTIIVSSGTEPSFLLPSLGILLFFWARSKRVVEEVVVVMPTLGVQLETVYQNRKVHRRFIPLQKIVAPVINEAISPVTCYFYLALLLRGEDNLVLIFLNLRPPLKMLVPIWRSLCDACGTSLVLETVSKNQPKKGITIRSEKAPVG